VSRQEGTNASTRGATLRKKGKGSVLGTVIDLHQKKGGHFSARLQWKKGKIRKKKSCTDETKGKPKTLMTGRGLKKNLKKKKWQAADRHQGCGEEKGGKKGGRD